MDKEAIELGVAAAASKSTYGGAATSFLGWLLSSEFTIIVGLVVAVGGFIVNWYYKREANRRQAAESALRMELMRRAVRPVVSESCPAREDVL